MFEYLVYYEYKSLTPWSKEIRIETDGEKLRYRLKETGYGLNGEVSDGLYEGDVEAFINKLESFHIEQWPLEFFKPVLDGYGWSLRYKEVGKPCRKIKGSNAYPDCFKDFLDLLVTVPSEEGGKQ